MSKITRLNNPPPSEADGQRLHLRELPEPESVGQELRAVRLRRGDELARVSGALRIRKDYLDAIESDLPDKLPGRAYGIGFVRSYADYLGLDSRDLVARYKRETAESAEASSWTAPPPEPEPFRIGPAWILAVVAVVGVVAFGLYVLVRPPPANFSAAPPAKTRVVDRVGPARHIVPPDALSKPTMRAVAAEPTGAPGSATQSPAGQTLGMQNRTARVVLFARTLAHVLVQGPDGKVYINRVLHPGDVYRVPNLMGLSLTTPDGGAVLLELDGQNMGPAGKPGRIAEAVSLDAAIIVMRRGAANVGASNKVTP